MDRDFLWVAVVSGPVNALAVLDETHDWLYRSSEGRGDDERAERVKSVRAAVAELIEANKAYDLALAALENFYRTISERGYLAAQVFNARELTEAFIRADDRRCKAVLAVAPLQSAAP